MTAHRQNKALAWVLLAVSAGPWVLLPSLARATEGGVMDQSSGIEEGPRNAAEKELFQHLQCLCGDCQRLTIGDCRCGYAAEKRAWVRKQLESGKSPDQVREAWKSLRDPKGQPFALRGFTTPPNTGFYRLGWVFPYVGILFAAAGVFAIGRRWRRRQVDEGPAGGGVTSSPAAGAGAQPARPADQASEEYRRRLRAELDDLDD